MISSGVLKKNMQVEFERKIALFSIVNKCVLRKSVFIYAEHLIDMINL